MGDLAEQYEARGAWWYWRQALGAIRARSIGTLLTATETNLSAADFIGDLIIGVALGLFCIMQLGMCAVVLIDWTGLIRSELTIVVVAPLMGVALIAIARLAHEFRSRIAREP